MSKRDDLRRLHQEHAKALGMKGTLPDENGAARPGKARGARADASGASGERAGVRASVSAPGGSGGAESKPSRETGGGWFGRVRWRWAALALLISGIVLGGLLWHRLRSDVWAGVTTPLVYTYYDEGPMGAALTTREGELLAVSADRSFIVYRAASGEEFYIECDDQGRAKRFTERDGRTFLFANYTDSTVDVAVIEPDGEITTHRDTPLPGNVAVQRDEEESALLISRVVEWAERGVSKDEAEISHLLGAGGDSSFLAREPDLLDYALFVGAATGVTIAFIMGAPIAAVAAGVLGLGLTVARMTTQSETAFVSSASFDVFTCALLPVEPIGGSAACVGSARTFYDVSREADRLYEQRQSEALHLAQSALEYSTGDVQVTLTWDNHSDVDLWVRDPHGELIGFSNMRARSGGQLDVDNRTGFGPENIFWPPGESPPGRYKVYVHHFASRGAANYRVLVNVGGRERQFTGRLEANDRTMHKVWSFEITREGRLITYAEMPCIRTHTMEPQMNAHARKCRTGQMWARKEVVLTTEDTEDTEKRVFGRHRLIASYDGSHFLPQTRYAE